MMRVPRNVGSPWQMAGSATMYWADVVLLIVKMVLGYTPRL